MTPPLPNPSFGTRRQPIIALEPAIEPSWQPYREQIAAALTALAAHGRVVKAQLVGILTETAQTMRAQYPARNRRPRAMILRPRAILIRPPLLAEIRATFVRLFAYACGLAVLATICAQFFQSQPVIAAIEPAPKPEWITIGKPYPALALTLPDLGEEGRYAIRRHSDGGGRKDTITFGEPGRSLRYVTVEIYRPGTEQDAFGAPASEIATRAADLKPAGPPKPALPVPSKFGQVGTYEFAAGRFGIGHCIGFVHQIEDPRLQIAGLSCSMDSLVNRKSVACALDRLTLMSAGSDPDIARYFAQAEIRRNFCGQREPLLAATPRREPKVERIEPMTLRGRFSS